MNEKLIVKNFGPIKNAELDLKKVTIFIGPQGSGKSSLAKLIAIFNNSQFLSDAYIGKSNDDYFSKYQAQHFIKKESFVTYENSNYKAIYNSGQLLDLTILNLIINEEKKISFVLNKLKDDLQRIKDFSSNNSDAERIVLYAFQNILNEDIRKLTSKVKYIPTDRLLISSISDSLLGLLRAEVALQKSTIEFGADFEISRQSSPTLLIDYLNITYKYENGRNLVFHNDTDSVPLSASASGFQSTIPVHLAVEHFSKEDNTYFIIEEPELNLFPTTQKSLVAYLADKCTTGNNELLITTHSPYVLSALNNLLFAYQVAKVLPEKANEIAQIIPKEQWLNPEDFAAYYVGEDEEGNIGGVRSIFNSKTGLIGENELDSISEELGDEFDALMNIYRTRKRETVN
ncbi:AAA family ATPase [Arcicella aquatica]|uniref:AAA family ATPase n=1 Tax=Arcicella aquatica TaxID=217141 RepID=A0ABU5QTB2_9BACT|nr:AAA family ATPase [Arcicella aquatica]MEA5260355.1 AAA family ATPase [Arcicella aquatica]